MTPPHSTIVQRRRGVSREIVIAVAAAVAVIVLGWSFYRYLRGRPQTERLSDFHFICQPEDPNNPRTITFTPKEWFERRKEILASKDGPRKFGDRKQVRLVECGDQWAYPAEKCPKDGAIFRNIPLPDEEARGIGRKDLTCPACGWWPGGDIPIQVEGKTRLKGPATRIPPTPIPSATPTSMLTGVDLTPLPTPKPSPTRPPWETDGKRKSRG